MSRAESGGGWCYASLNSFPNSEVVEASRCGIPEHATCVGTHGPLTYQSHACPLVLAFGPRRGRAALPCTAPSTSEEEQVSLLGAACDSATFAWAIGDDGDGASLTATHVPLHADALSADTRNVAETGADPTATAKPLDGYMCLCL